MAKPPSYILHLHLILLYLVSHAPGEQKQCYSLLKNDAKPQLLCVNSSDRDGTIWPWLNTTVRAAVFCASFGKQTHSPSIFPFLFLPCPARFPKLCSPTLPGASAAGERGPAEDGVRWREGRGHRLPRARSDAVLEGAADILRGVSSADYHWDGQAEVLQHGPRSDHVDGLYHLSDRDRREAQVSTLQEQEHRICIRVLVTVHYMFSTK